MVVAGRGGWQVWRALVDAWRPADAAPCCRYVWQGKSYEGLTCDALEWVDSYGGGAIVNAEGEVTINNPRAVEALERRRVRREQREYEYK